MGALAEPGPDPVPCDNRGTGAMRWIFAPYGRGWWGARRTAQRPHGPTAPMTSESARSRLALPSHPRPQRASHPCRPLRPASRRPA